VWWRDSFILPPCILDSRKVEQFTEKSCCRFGFRYPTRFVTYRSWYALWLLKSLTTYADGYLITQGCQNREDHNNHCSRTDSDMSILWITFLLDLSTIEYEEPRWNVVEESSRSVPTPIGQEELYESIENMLIHLDELQTRQEGFNYVFRHNTRAVKSWYNFESEAWRLRCFISFRWYHPSLTRPYRWIFLSSRWSLTFVFTDY
jgi:hypothetical protein